MINFVGRKKYWFALSGIAIAVSLAALIYHGGLNMGIDFKGGSRIQLRMKRAPQTAKVRAIMNEFGLGDAIIQPLGQDEILITTRYIPRNTAMQIIEKMNEKIGIAETLSTENVGPSFGKQQGNQALIALLVSLGAILLYISFRFELNSAIAAIIELIHDIIITVGVYALLNREVTVSTVAALLTILGYSLYDTVVVFDRVRENSKKMLRGESFGEMVNRSINQTLVRSINTALSALIPLSALLVFGGQTLKDFALALFVGMFSGAYSSIFIGSPLLAVFRGMQASGRRGAVKKPAVSKAIKKPAMREVPETEKKVEVLAGPTPKGKVRKPKKKRKR